jgi:hypothetical protein
MAKLQQADLLSAQVVLKPEAAAAPQEVLDAFRQAGLTVGPLVANNFSIVAPAAAFRSYFGVDLATARRGGLELPVDVLPAPIRDKVQAVLFTKLPDFGPGAQF